MSRVPTNLIPARITQLPEYQGTDSRGFFPYAFEGKTYKVTFDWMIDHGFNMSDQIPLPLGIAEPGISLDAARGDHIHPAVDLGDPSQIDGVLPPDSGGTGGAITPSPGSVIYSTDTALAATLQGFPGRPLVSKGTDAPVFELLGVMGGGTGTASITGYAKGNGVGPLVGVFPIPPADIVSAALTRNNDTNVTLTLGGNPAAALLASTSLTLGWAGQLAVDRGGTGAATLTGFLMGNGTGPFTASPTIPGAAISGNIPGNAANVSGVVAVDHGGTGAVTLTGYVKGAGTTPMTAVPLIPATDLTGTKAQFNGALSDGDFLYVGDPIPASGITGTKAQFDTALTDGNFVFVGDSVPAANISGGQPLSKTDDANVTLTLGGNPLTALLASTSLTMGWTGQLSVPRGGTGAATLTGYVKGNGTSPLTASATIPVADVTGAVSEAPNDGKEYARKNLAWAQVTGFPEAPTDGQQYARQNAAWSVVIPAVPEAPTDGAIYGRRGSDHTWQVAGGGSTAVLQREEVIATAGQTAFNFDTAYLPGSVEVYVNGVRLASSEYVESGGTLVTLTTGVAVGDIVLLESVILSGGGNMGSILTTEITATAGQTVFNAPYVVGSVNVYVNGVRQAKADYTATNGTSVTLANPALVNDIVVVESFVNVGPSGILAEAPTDGQLYSRRGSDASWQVSPSGGGSLPPSTMAQFDTACTDGNFAFQAQNATHVDLTATGAALIDNTLTTTHTSGFGTGATASGQTKTLNIGTGGLTGSTTQINYGGAGAIGTTHAFNGTFTQAGGQFTITTGANPVSIGSTSSVCNFGSTQSTGGINMGGTTATGVIAIGRSTSNQALDLGMGATLSGNTKTISIGANGVSGSTTNISYGSAVAGATSLHTFNGNILYAGTGRRIQGDWGNSATEANRTFFQSSTANASTFVSAMPNGTGTMAGFQAISSSGAVNYNYLNLTVDNVTASISTDKAGSATAVPLQFNVAGVRRMQIDQGGTVSVLRDGSSEIRLMNNNSRGWRIIQDSVTTTLGSLYIQASTDGFVSSFLNTFSIDNAGQVHSEGQAYWLNANRCLWQHDGTNVYFRATNLGSGVYIGVNNSNVWLFSTAGHFYPVIDNVYNCGHSGNRWASIWAGTGTIQTSDARLKAWRGGLKDAELAAAKDIARSIGVYQWNDAIAEKGEDGARLHTGVAAQTVGEIMERHGLDPHRYGFFCWDEWEEQVHPGGEGAEDTITPAGERYSIRYDELAMFIAAAQEQRLAALEAML